MVAVKSSPLIHGQGTSSVAWRRWLSDRNIPSCAFDDAPHAPPRVVVVAPHPDDEVLACGGLLAQHAARGGEVLVVAVTDGEASHTEAEASVDASHCADLAEQRRLERLLGLAQLGLSAKTVHAMHLPDGQVKTHGQQLRSELLNLLRPGDTVLSTWEHDGHPDHDASGHATRHACLAIGCRFLSAPVWMWHWASVGDIRVPWHRLHRMALSQDLLQRKLAALAAHATQLTPRSATVGAVLGAAIQERAAWCDEYFFL